MTMKTEMTVNGATHRRRIALLRHPDIGGVPSNTGYMVE